MVKDINSYYIPINSSLLDTPWQKTDPNTMPRNPPWTDLPQELLSSIANFLPNPLHIITFRSLCKSFYSSLPFPSHLLSSFYPLLLPSPPSSSSSSSSSKTTSCILTTTSIFFIRPWVSSSTFIWFVFFDELNPGTLSIRRPFTRYDFFLPLDFPTKLILSDFEFQQLGMFYNVSYVDFASGKFVKKGSWNSDFDKVVVFGNGVGLVSLYSDGKLGFLRFGDGCQWRVLHDGKGFRFDDIVEFKGRVLGIDRRARVYEMIRVGCDDMSIKLNVVAPAISGGGGRRKRLIESFGCLYLVVRMNCSSHKKNDDMSEFRVYVMNDKVMKWVLVNGIDNRVFLFGLDFSVACDAHKFEGLVDGNCIIFYDHSFACYNDAGYWRFHFTNPKYGDLPVSIYRFETGAKIEAIKSLPSYSSLFWPPPTWIWPNEVSKLCGTFMSASNRLLKGILDDKLKANYQELSFKVRGIVAGDYISKLELLKMVKNADMLLKFLYGIVEEVRKDTEFIKSSITDEAVARRRQIIFMNNQEGTSSSNAEDKNGSSENEWLSNEISQRLGTHCALRKFFNDLIRVFRRNRDEFQAAAAAAVDETRFISFCTNLTKLT